MPTWANRLLSHGEMRSGHIGDCLMTLSTVVLPDGRSISYVDGNETDESNDVFNRGGYQTPVAARPLFARRHGGVPRLRYAIGLLTVRP